MKQIILLTVLLAGMALFLPGCGKIALNKPGHLPAANIPEPIFNNGDVVRYKMLGDRDGIMMTRDYKYLTELKTWYCIVDFYPSSALIHFDFSSFDNYERRYVYEFELELVRKYSKIDEHARKRWIRD